MTETDWVTQLEREAFELDIAGRPVTGEIISPSANALAEHPALVVVFAGTAAKALHQSPYNITARYFLERGHRALSIDLPNHGPRVDKFGEGIVGLRNAFIAGHRRFQRFASEGVAVIDHVVERGLATPGRMAVAGTSRGGYAALRLLSEDIRIVAAAGFAPVTDWRFLREFADDAHRDDVAVLRLHCFTQGMAGRAVFLVIGHDDQRVNTASCCQLYLDLLMANLSEGFDRPAIDFYCTADNGHSCGEAWYKRGAAFLLEQIEAAQTASET